MKSSPAQRIALNRISLERKPQAPKTSWWAVPPEQFKSAYLRELDRMTTVGGTGLAPDKTGVHRSAVRDRQLRQKPEYHEEA